MPGCCQGIVFRRSVDQTVDGCLGGYEPIKLTQRPGTALWPRSLHDPSTMAARPLNEP